MSRRTAGVVLCSVAALALAGVRVAEALHDDSGSTIEDSYFATFVAGFLLLVGFFLIVWAEQGETLRPLYAAALGFLFGGIISLGLSAITVYVGQLLGQVFTYLTVIMFGLGLICLVMALVRPNRKTKGEKPGE